MNDVLLEMRGITKTFPGVIALDNVQLTLRKGRVMALMGENGAGKSTLMKVLFGIYQRDAGTIVYQGEHVSFNGAKEALENGISMIHQELSPILHRSIAENIWLGREPVKGPLQLIDHDKMYRDTEELLQRLNLNLNPRTQMHELTVATMQMVEIAKAISYHSKIIIMDEPTSALTDKEVTHLFEIIEMLKSKGVAIVYISHKMAEIFQICDDITVFRDGCYIGEREAQYTNNDELVQMMVGRDLGDVFPPPTAKPGKVRLEVKNLTVEGAFSDISFKLHEGEILGIAGLVGAGRTELIETLFGVRHKDAGEIWINGNNVEIHTPQDAIKHKMAFLTEDRRQSGLYLMLDIFANTSIAHLDAYRNKVVNVLDVRRMRKDSETHCQKLKVKTPNMHEAIDNLSGGNQQKVLLARWMLTKPDILFLDEPTRGIDVGAKSEIYKLMRLLTGMGKSLVMISSELPEVIGMSDRILIMHEGQLKGMMTGTEATQEDIMSIALN
ncbi:sugar ABC transporter ATP-binding protein [Photobacterium aphoticum]|uniref:Ribose/galactose/methyl galactoside import ATP-binding protein n=1 Tax=Photobacterium aphoticum TaxID=754436 RepID=A0A0J1GQI2_9GAMM|nr:sugar ABC transporter ATP-binding protein [Photobacterium aphoticum]KLV01896.1 D-ribose transporter ATP-binding protein [Photobacterium aphoticum]PSU60128.1 sugar ABC transporter ATP-binding protein [Photobacterium aphoticum]GHA33356.1 galactose/methyl galactoside import ATP-binding protein MglA [Photobacterium aphoticum]